MSVTGLVGMMNIKGLVPDIQPPEEIFAGMASTFKLRISNTKRFIPSFLIRVECFGGQGVTIPLVPRSDSASGNVTLTFTERGHAGIGQIVVSSPFPVNFFTRYWIFAVDRDFVVFPRLIHGPLSGNGLEKRTSGSSIHHGRGLDGELERISAYSGREPLRMIHWKLSARSDDLLVKIFGSQATMPLIIDLNAQPGQGMEERISHAAWLVKHWVHNRPVGLKFENRIIPAEAGHRHGLKLMTELALWGKDNTI